MTTKQTTKQKNLTVTELADRLGVHRNSVIYWIRNGQVKAGRVGLAPKSPYVIDAAEAARVEKLHKSLAV